MLKGALLSLQISQFSGGAYSQAHLAACASGARNLPRLALESSYGPVLVVFKCGQSVFALVTVFDRQITQAENLRFQRREVIDGGNGNCFYRAVALWKNETSDEKHEEISRLSSRLFQENPKVFKLPLLAIFKYKHSHGYLNTKIFYSNFFS